MFSIQNKFLLALIMFVFFTSIAQVSFGSENQNHRFNIRFDYRFDSEGFFSTFDRKKTLQAAADIFGDIIADDFPAIPAGTKIHLSHPVTEKAITYELEKEIDDVLVLVFTTQAGPDAFKAYASYMSGYASLLNKKFQPRVIYIVYNTTTARPWFFDQTPETSWDIPNSTHHDIFSTTMHEMGHGLVFLVSVYEETGNYKKNTFIGENAMKANGGKPIILEKDSSHISRKTTTGLLRPNLDELLMHAVSPVQGFRFLPTKIDMAMMRDLGYTVRMDKIPRPDDYPPRNDPRTNKYGQRHPRAGTDKKYPVGLWYLDKFKFVYNTILGHPGSCQ